MPLCEGGCPECIVGEDDGFIDRDYLARRLADG
jgi:hypothetical protein